MQIQILCVGKIKDGYLSSGIAEFEKRLKPYVKITVTELADVRVPEKCSAAGELVVKEKEGEEILGALRSDWVTAVLDLNGQEVTSEEFAKFIGDCKIRGENLAFVIGGPLGLSRDVLCAADKKISFSRLTFTHTMCRLILFEQIYRAFRILSGEPYHK